MQWPVAKIDAHISDVDNVEQIFIIIYNNFKIYSRDTIRSWSG